MKKLFPLLICLFISSQIFGADIIKLPLETVEKQALANSPKIKQPESLMQSQQAAYESEDSYLYPSLTLDARGGWVSEIPSLKLAGNSLKFGDNWSYSAGPTLQYTLFDKNRRKNKSKSSLSAYESQKQELESAKKQILLQARQAYFKIQRDLEKIYFLSEYLNLTQKQLKDINSAFKIGNKNKLDVIMAEKQFIRAKLNISNARAALSQDLSELFKITVDNFSIDARYPLDYRIDPNLLDGETSSLIEFDSLDNTLAKFVSFENFTFDENQAKLLSYDKLINSYKYLSDSFKSGLYPRINLSGGAYFEYPNGPITEDIFLGRVNASLSMPLFEKSRTKKQSEAQKNMADSVIYRKQDMQEQLESIFDFSKTRLYSLNIENTLIEKMINDAKDGVKLTYNAYNAGSVTFLEVQNANIDLLSAQTDLANLKIEKLNCLAIMDNLGK
ncbi:MAG: TolC family protein [Endomicrobiaceae bacterium]|nr:TolC family protein [Endomicrobiaceae bacterium]